MAEHLELDRGSGVRELRGGELNAAIASALVGIQSKCLGRGPKKTIAFHQGTVVVVLMHEVLTPAERSLAEADQAEAVYYVRHLLQGTMEPEFREAVERLTDRRVIGFISGNQIDPDIAAEVFVLDRPL